MYFKSYRSIDLLFSLKIDLCATNQLHLHEISILLILLSSFPFLQGAPIWEFVFPFDSQNFLKSPCHGNKGLFLKSLNPLHKFL